MPAPTWRSTGAVAYLAGSPISVPYPAGIVAGDLLILQTMGNRFFSTGPSGWTSLHYRARPDSRHHYVYYKKAVGNESGSLSVSMDAGNAPSDVLAQIQAFANVKAINFLESNNGNAFSDTSSSATADSITTTGSDRLAVACIARGRDGNTFGDNWTGESGGTWILRGNGDNAAGLNLGVGIFTASMPFTGTISGGSAVSPASVNGNYSTRSFALIGESLGRNQSMVIA